MTIAEKTCSPCLWARALAPVAAFALTGALLAGAFTPLPALAVGPSPKLQERMKQNPALARRVQAALSRAQARGIDGGVALSRGPLARHIVSAAAAASSGVAVSPAGAPLRSALAATTRTANLKMLVLLVDFPDAAHQLTPSFFDDLMFADVTGPRSVRGYYREVSAGQLDIVPVPSDVPSSVGWLRMPQTIGYYTAGGDGGRGVYPHNGQKLFEDACAAANAAGVDFSQYDGDRDGYVDGVAIVHAGRGAEYTDGAKDIWSHQWWAQNEYVYDGVKIGPYSTEPEYWTTPGDMTSGVFAHEFGHVFGLPDLYDTDYSSQGLGTWSLMAGGEWNGPNDEGGSPARFDAWSLTQLGLVRTADATSAINAETIYAATSSLEGTVVRVERSGGTTGKEYFLVENRQKRGTDAYLAGSGLLIYHVDATRADNDTESRYLVDLEEAHGGTQHLELAWDDRTNSNDGDAGDPFPGSSNSRIFSDTTSPNAHYYDGLASKVRIDSIGSSSPTMTARVVPDVTFASTDFSAPISSSNAVPSYLSTATIVLIAHDEPSGSGVKAIRWTLDGVAGTGATVTTAAFGDHHLVFWAEDNAGHVESPHTVDFTVGDMNPPVVTANVAASYSSVAVTLTLSATDTPAGSGLASISYQLDGGSVMTTAASPVTVPVTGAGTHTITYWSQDLSGNTSAHLGRSFVLNERTVITLTSGNVTIWSGVPFRVTGRIDPLGSTGDIAGKRLRLQKLSGSWWVWAGVADAALASNHTFSFAPKPTRNTTYRVVAVTTTGLLPGTSNTPVRAYVRAALGMPSVPSAIRRYVTFSARGSVLPRDIGTVLVRWYRYNSNGTRYSYGTPKTVAVSSAGTWYARKKLPRGRFAVRVTHGDASHAYSSSAYRTFRVR